MMNIDSRRRMVYKNHPLIGRSFRRKKYGLTEWVRTIDFVETCNGAVKSIGVEIIHAGHIYYRWYGLDEIELL